MSEAKHTPGPWVVCIQDGDDVAYTVFAETQLVNRRIEADAWDDHLATAGLNHKNVEANARLIAAAPELLKALDNIGGLSRALRAGGPDPMDLQGLSDALEEAVDMAHAAIAKATGAA